MALLSCRAAAPSGSPPCHVQKEQLRAGEGEDSPVAIQPVVPSAHIRTVQGDWGSARLSILSVVTQQDIVRSETGT